jgi:hypothetical protein
MGNAPFTHTPIPPIWEATNGVALDKLQPDTEEAGMRAEAEKLAETVRNSLALLRRHL